MSTPPLTEQIDALIAKPTNVDGLNDTTVDWIRDVIVLLEAAADTIEHLTNQRDRYQKEAEAYIYLHEMTWPTYEKRVVHSCDVDPPADWHRYNTETTEPDPCIACEIEKIAKHVHDHEELPWWAPDLMTFRVHA